MEEDRRKQIKQEIKRDGGGLLTAIAIALFLTSLGVAVILFPVRPW